MPFHEGELAVQKQAGLEAEAQRVCSALKSGVEPPAAEFLRLRRFAIASSLAPNGNLWASLLTGPPGFVAATSDQTLVMGPLVTSDTILVQNLQSNPTIGLLTLDLEVRRRLRVNGRVQALTDQGMQIQVQQVFFNCPKYIQTRHLISEPTQPPQPPLEDCSVALTQAQQAWITHADTFFVATAHPQKGADISHRGGYPGFLQIISSYQLLFPDYKGNNMFQSFGNISVNPKIGLLFLDFERGHTLQLTGQAELLWDDPRLPDFNGAQRLVRFTIEQVRLIREACPLRWEFGEYSPINP